MTDEEIRETRLKVLEKDLASINNRLHHAFNQGFELGRKSTTPKETPRMVHYEADGYADGEWVYDMAECPACGNRMTEDNDDIWEVAKYCPECGQRIIWEAENE